MINNFYPKEVVMGKSRFNFYMLQMQKGHCQQKSSLHFSLRYPMTRYFHCLVCAGKPCPPSKKYSKKRKLAKGEFAIQRKRYCYVSSQNRIFPLLSEFQLVPCKDPSVTDFNPPMYKSKSLNFTTILHNLFCTRPCSDNLLNSMSGFQRGGSNKETYPLFSESVCHINISL